MANLEILHFEQLKSEVQAQYLKNNNPSNDQISKWKGIDIIYFQEDLRKLAKGNISEKSFYTYFKTSPVTKIPRIDMLNILSIYAGYASWYDFKKCHLFENEILSENEEEASETGQSEQKNDDITTISPPIEKIDQNEVYQTQKTVDLQNNNNVNQDVKENEVVFDTYDTSEQNTFFSFVKKHVWIGISSVLVVIVGLLGFSDQIFAKEFTYSFIDEDRNSRINADLDVRILKENESPIIFTIKPNAQFKYPTKSKKLVMVVSSPYYKTDTIRRNLETAPLNENIVLKPNDNAIMLYYYSKSPKTLKDKRASLNYLISDQALIYQVFDNEFYGVETMDKSRYITLVTLPSTSLENLEVIDTKIDKNGKIVMIKFKIASDEKKK